MKPILMPILSLFSITKNLKSPHAARRLFMLLALLGLAGCGRAPDSGSADSADSEPSASVSPTAESALSTPSPTVAPTPEMNPAATPAVSPEAATTPTPARRVVYVVTAFKARSEIGIHDFPVGAAVNVLSEEGDDLMVEYNGVAVRNARTFFSETPPAALPSPAPIKAETPLPQEPLPEASPQSEMQAIPAPPVMSPEEQKTSAMLDEIRTLNEEIRTADNVRDDASSAEAKADESKKINQLKERRNEISEDLTEIAKP